MSPTTFWGWTTTAIASMALAFAGAAFPALRWGVFALYCCLSLLLLFYSAIAIPPVEGAYYRTTGQMLLARFWPGLVACGLFWLFGGWGVWIAIY